MQGYVLTRYGGARAMQLREVPKPTAGDGEVLIRVHAAGLNPVDHTVRLRWGAASVASRPAIGGRQ